MHRRRRALPHLVLSPRALAHLALTTALLIVLGGTACTVGLEQDDDPEASAGVSATPPWQLSPGPVRKGQAFGLEDTAVFDDGLEVEIAGTEATTAKDTFTGAELTKGQIVVLSVRFENGSGETFDPRDTIIAATYGNGTVARMIQDSSGELTNGFDAEVAVEDEAVATVGFAIPFAELAKVTVIVDCNDDQHDPVSFTGRVRRS